MVSQPNIILLRHLRLTVDVADLLTDAGRMRIFLGVQDKTHAVDGSSSLPLVFQCGEWPVLDTFSEKEVWRRWAPAARLFASSATVPRRDDEYDLQLHLGI